MLEFLWIFWVLACCKGLWLNSAEKFEKFLSSELQENSPDSKVGLRSSTELYATRFRGRIACWLLTMA
jgi:hypothetical protein